MTIAAAPPGAAVRPTLYLTRPQPTLDDLLSEANWLELRELVMVPLISTELITTDQSRAEFVEGARLLRLDKMIRAGDGGTGPTPIQLAIADMLNAGYFKNGVLEPRRTTKTTSVQAVLLGRCSIREDYVVGWTLATTGAKASERFRKDIVTPINRLYPNPKDAPFKLNVGKGTEHIEWTGNGSWFYVYAPGGDGFRSGGFDAGWVDEGGEAEPELGADLTTAVLPTMDTKVGAQFIVSGTGATYREGNLLWDTLNDPEAGVIRHSVPDQMDPEELEDWEPSADHPKARVRELIELYHPGVSWTTPLANVERNFRAFTRDQFNREYLGLFGSEGSNVGLIPPAHWERTTLAGAIPPPPKAFSLAIAIHPDGLWSSIGVAFHFLDQPDDLVSEALRMSGDAEPAQWKVGVGLLHHQHGVSGFANKVLQFARKYGVGIVYDQLSQSVGVEVETLSKAMPRPNLIPATTVDVRRAATKLLKGLSPEVPGKPDPGVDVIRHWSSATLDNAVTIAVKRAIGTAGGFGFGRPKGDYAADITPVEAISLALQFLGDRGTKKPKVDVTFG